MSELPPMPGSANPGEKPVAPVTEIAVDATNGRPVSVPVDRRSVDHIAADDLGDRYENNYHKES